MILVWLKKKIVRSSYLKLHYIIVAIQKSNDIDLVTID